MTAAKAAAPARPSAGRPAGAARWHGAMFGIELSAAVPITGLEPGDRRVEPGATSFDLASDAEVRRAWPSRETVEVLSRRFVNGRPMMSIHRHPDAGYRVWAPRHGAHLVSNDGRRVLSAVPDPARWRWQRLVLAQVLPLAATLRGRELFHASAVALAGNAAGFVARAGTGKTSLAAHLVARGAALVTDDVLALTAEGDGVAAHPGAGVIGVHRAELADVPASQRDRFGRVLARADKLYLASDVAPGPVPLAALYFLERGPQVDAFELRRIVAPHPRDLLRSSFIPYVGTPDRLANQLAVCARIAETVPAFAVSVPPGLNAADLAVEVERHLRGLVQS